MSIIGWIIIGAIAGWLASLIMGRNATLGWLGNIVVGILGALIGGFLYGLLTDSDFVADFDLGTLLVSIVGAVVLLFILGLFRRPAA